MECWLMTCQTCTRKLWPVKIKLFLRHFWQSTHGGHFPSRNYTAFFWSIVSYGTCEEKHFDEFPWPYVQDHEHTHMSNNSIFSYTSSEIDRNYCCNVMVLSKDIFIWQFFKRIFYESCELSQVSVLEVDHESLQPPRWTIFVLTTHCASEKL